MMFYSLDLLQYKCGPNFSLKPFSFVILDDRLLAPAYSAAYVVVVTSSQDNLSNTAVEAQACGIPVLAFDISGLPEIIEHQHTGWLGCPFDTTDPAAGITWVLADVQRAQNLAVATREIVESRFSESIFVEQYRSLFCQYWTNRL